MVHKLEHVQDLPMRAACCAAGWPLLQIIKSCSACLWVSFLDSHHDFLRSLFGGLPDVSTPPYSRRKEMIIVVDQEGDQKHHRCHTRLLEAESA